MNPKIVLASTSRYRASLLEQLGLPFTAVAPAYEEEHALPLAPEQLVVELARRKAESVAADHPGALIIGSDQGAEVDGQLLGKPGTRERAVDQLARLSGRTHRLLTGVALHDARTGTTRTELTVHRMTMRTFTQEEARRYVERDEPTDCAGAYRVEALGISLFESMAGDDCSAIVGLPLLSVVRLLIGAGVSIV